MSPVNPEAIGVYGLIVTVICFGLEQVGVGVKGGEPRAITKSLSFIAIIFGGCTQLFTSLWFYLFNIGGDPAHSIYLGTVFGFFGLFWVLVGVFFLAGGDKKQMAHFFICGFFLVLLFTIRAIQFNLIWPLAVVLAIICVLLAALPVAWYKNSVVATKIAGVCNIAIGLTAIPLLLSALGF